MSYINIFYLTIAMLLFAATPGPGTFAIISRSLKDGFYYAAIMTFGLIVGDIIYLIIAIYGLNIVASMMQEFFIIIKYLGGIYLIYLGYKIFTSETKPQNYQNLPSSKKSTFLSGFFITISNPKVIIFYLGFLPAFIDLQTLTTLDIFIVIFIVAISLAIVMLGYSYLAHNSRKFFQNQNSISTLNKTSGAIMAGAGGFLILKN